MQNRQTLQLIEINGLSKTFRTADGQVDALDDVHLTIHEGDIYGIVGMSGAGKSTLIRCINRLDTPTSGDVLLRGQSILRMNEQQLISARRKMSMIFQQFNLFMQRTVAGNVRYPLEISGVPKAAANQRVSELLDIVGLGDKANAYPAQLSGGQKQRVAIARALASNPEVLLSDEATSALDPMTTQSILSLLSDINRRLGITIILITHEMAVIRQICTRVAILDGGKLVEEGAVDEVFMHTKSLAGKRLFGILPETPDEDPDVPSLRIVFDGSSAEQPIIANLVREHGVMVNILSANIKHLGGKTYGQMLIEMPKELGQVRLITDYLTRPGLTVKEVNIK
ncbi:MAG: ATP-binding cassette domain-containing protein [Clostridiales bacterium]|nr:ATP-binding cassette domain-containing protein [Clostridiales bacterium]